jgi:hypothetical protein
MGCRCSSLTGVLTEVIGVPHVAGRVGSRHGFAGPSGAAQTGLAENQFGGTRW